MAQSEKAPIAKVEDLCSVPYHTKAINTMKTLCRKLGGLLED